jgi:hypothetical protein
VASIQYSQWQARSRVQPVIAWIIVALALLYFASLLVVPQTITLHQMNVLLVFYAAALLCADLRWFTLWMGCASNKEARRKVDLRNWTTSIRHWARWVFLGQSTD